MTNSSPTLNGPCEWKLVPVEPTLAMLAAFEDGNGWSRECWANMLAAAPTPCVTPDIITRLDELEKKRVYRNYVRGRYSGDCTLFSDNGDERSIAASFSRAQDAEFMEALEEAWPLLRKAFLDVPTGWKLVPVEPTEAMVWTGHKAGEESLTGGDLIDMAAAYRAMLDAAPTPCVTPDIITRLDEVKAIIRKELTDEQVTEGHGWKSKRDVLLAGCKAVGYGHPTTAEEAADKFAEFVAVAILRSLSLARGDLKNCDALSATNQQPPRSSLEGEK